MSIHNQLEKTFHVMFVVEKLELNVLHTSTHFPYHIDIPCADRSSVTIALSAVQVRVWSEAICTPPFYANLQWSQRGN